MIDIPVEDFIFVVCALIGGGLLLITVLVDDILGAVFDFDVGGVSLMPLLLSFVSMFGVGGLFATQVLDVHGGQAAIWGRRRSAWSGLAIAYLIFSTLRRAEAPAPFSTSRPRRSGRVRPGGDPGRPLRQRPGQGGGPDPRVQRDSIDGHRRRDGRSREWRRRLRAHRRASVARRRCRHSREGRGDG